MDKLPISVIIPTFNRSALLPRAIASVRAQRPWSPSELLVIDDGSSDSTAETAERLGATVIRHERNAGLAAARNSGVEAASQPWLALLDDDDEWLPHHLATLWGLRDGHALVAGSALACAEDASVDRINGPVTAGERTLNDPGRLLCLENYIPVSAAIARTEAVRAAGGFTPRHGVVEDLQLWARLLAKGTGEVSRQVTVVVHRHDERMSLDRRRMQAGRLAVIDSLDARPWWATGLAERRLGIDAWENLRDALRAGHRRQAIGHATRVLGHPRRLVGVASIVARRARVRRLSSRVARDGGPTVAILPGAARHQEAAGRQAGEVAVVDLTTRRGFAAAWLGLLRRPTGVALASSRVEATLLRAIGVRPVVEVRDLARTDSRVRPDSAAGADTARSKA